tara:strand:+ start:54 stop:551 length:498 start_codon:yes stop_codon:yes gene_type:complete
MKQWYLVQFKPNSYRIAERNLVKQGVLTFLPLLETTNRDNFKFKNNVKPLFPGYMFIEIDLNVVYWHKINNTIGVTRLVSHGGKPQEISKDVIIGLMSRCDEQGILLEPKTPVIGDCVKLLKGAFAEFIATVETIDSDKRIWVMMDLMGRSTRIQVAAENLKINQ